MIKHQPSPLDPVQGEIPGRARAWMASFPGGMNGGPVIVRHYITDQQPDEDLRDYPDTHELTWDEWLNQHRDYGLDSKGRPLDTEGTG